MRDLNWEIKQLGERHRDGSYATQAGRARTLSSFATFTHDAGHTRLTLRGIKDRHVDAFVAHCQDKGLATGTLKNIIAHLRWMAEKIGKQNIVARRNDCYGIADRVYVTNESKARELTAEQLNKITDPYCAMSLRLQALFGLRREESLKIRPGQADRGDVLHLQASWCKGGRARDIPIRTKEQQQLLDAAKALANGGSLIPRRMYGTTRTCGSSARNASGRISTRCMGTGTVMRNSVTGNRPSGNVRPAAGRPRSN
jgi:hypothetical protein